MPIYEDTCRKCGREFELLRRVSEMDAPAKCLHCSSRATSRKLSRFAIVRDATSDGSPDGDWDDHADDGGDSIAHEHDEDW